MTSLAIITADTPAEEAGAIRAFGLTEKSDPTLCCMDRQGQSDRGKVKRPVPHRCSRKPLCRSRPTPTASITSRSSGTG